MHATGLVNLGNTCNLNAAAQLLAHCAPFSAALMADPSSIAGSDKDATLSRVVAQPCSALHERGLKSAVRGRSDQRASFCGFRQDVHQLLCLPLEGCTCT